MCHLRSRGFACQSILWYLYYTAARATQLENRVESLKYDRIRTRKSHRYTPWEHVAGSSLLSPQWSKPSQCNLPGMHLWFWHRKSVKQSDNRSLQTDERYLRCAWFNRSPSLMILSLPTRLTRVTESRVSDRQMWIWTECTTKTNVKSARDRRDVFPVSERL